MATKRSKARKAIPTPDVSAAEAPAGAQYKTRKPRKVKKAPAVVLVPSPEQGDHTSRISEATLNRVGKVEIRAIARSRGYWAADSEDNRRGTRATVAAFLAKQKGDKVVKGTEL